MTWMRLSTHMPLLDKYEAVWERDAFYKASQEIFIYLRVWELLMCLFMYWRFGHWRRGHSLTGILTLFKALTLQFTSSEQILNSWLCCSRKEYFPCRNPFLLPLLSLLVLVHRLWLSKIAYILYMIFKKLTLKSYVIKYLIYWVKKKLWSSSPKGSNYFK